MSRARTIVLGLVAATLLPPAAPRAETDVFSVDPVHSEVGFRVRHLISSVAGEFQDFTAKVTLDPQNVAGTLKLDATIETASVSTNNERRDKHLRSDDFFNAEKYPEIRFVSKSVRALGGDRYRVTGDLTIRDVTREVALDVDYFGVTTNPFTGTPMTGLDVTGRINRQDFGVRWNKTFDDGRVMLSDTVDLDIHLEASVPKPPKT